MDRYPLISFVTRYRPYVVLVVAIALLSLVPARHGDSDVSTTGPERTSSAGTSYGGGKDSSGASDAAANVQSGAAGDRAASGAGAGRAGATGGATAADDTGGPLAVSPPAPTGAGLNTDEALAQPDCDPNTKRVKVAFSRAAPCAVPWPEGADNGGATTMGVSTDAIHVVIYNPASDPSSPPIGRSDRQTHLKNWNDASEPYHRFYRMWGRTVQYDVFESTGNDEVAQRADAIKIANMKPFATVQVPANNTVLITELAARGVIVIAQAGVSQVLAEKLAPYVWNASVQPPELVALSAANYVARRLVGQPARWAGQADYQATPRQFGLLAPDELDLRFFEDGFARQGGTLTDRQQYSFGAAHASEWAEQSRTLVGRMKKKGVSTVIAIADFLFLSIMTKEATNQQWFPEWVTTGYLGNDIDIFAKTFDQVQWQHAFGMGTLYAGTSKLAPQFHFQEWYWGNEYQPGSEGLGPDETPVLHSGIHGAGPNLTPETFRNGVFAVQPTGGAVIGGKMTMAWSYGRWGLYPGDDYNGYDDFTEIWWDVQGQGRDNLLGEETVGLYRYVNLGARYLFDQWPTGEPKMFDMEGVAPYYDDYATPQERPPDYPCPDCPSTR